MTFRYRPVGSAAAGTLIGSDATAPFTATWTTSPAAEQQWELIAVATDGGGNVSTSAPRVVLVDRTLPTGSVTAPLSGDTVGGPAVALTATAADLSGSGVTQVAWQVRLFGAGTFNTVATDTSAPYDGTWNATGAPDGATDVRALITDAAGNVQTTAVVPVTVDSTGPSVTLADPGAFVSGIVALTASTGGGAVRVAFGVSPAGAGTWTEIASDTSAPFGTSFDTRTVADGPYDLRAIGYDALGNPSAPSVRTNVRFDNIAPTLVSSTPGDGSVSASANQIVLTASEPVTAPGAQLDGVPAPVPVALGLDADVRDGLTRRRSARALGRARGRERHADVLPRRRHDREHAVGRPAAGRAQHHLVRRLDDDGSGRPGHGQAAAGRVADPAHAAGLHPGAPRRRPRAERRLRARHTGRRRDRALGDRGHVRDRVPRAASRSSSRTRAASRSSRPGRRTARRPGTPSARSTARRFRPSVATASTATRPVCTCSRATSPSSA